MPRSLSRLSERVFVLNCLEFAVFLLRGDQSRYGALMQSGVPALIESCPQGVSDIEILESLQEIISHQDNPDDFAAELGSEYIRLFVSASGGVPAPPYQSCHEPGGRVMGPAADRMAERLTRWGLEPEANEPPDHIAYQLELLHVLLSTYWSQKGDGAAPAAQELAKELVSWLPSLKEKLEQDSPGNVFSLTVALILEQCRAVAQQPWS